MKSKFNELSRVSKALVDSEKVKNFAEAEAILRNLRLKVYLGSKAGNTLAGQAAALTAIVTAERCFRGGVELVCDPSQALLLPIGGGTVEKAARGLGAVKVEGEVWELVIGDREQGQPDGPRVWWDGWRAGFRPAGDVESCGEGRNVLAGVAAGAMGVGQIFALGALRNIRACKFPLTVSLWDPEDPHAKGLDQVNLPSSLWFVGLGNLGQAYLWALSLLPYKKPEDLKLVFQDMDKVNPENRTTSILTNFSDMGKYKTRVADSWAKSCGFNPRIYDFPLDKDFRVPGMDSYYCLAGLDRMEPRRILKKKRFKYVISAGLGAKASNFDRFGVDLFDFRSRVFQPKTHYGEDGSPADVQAKELTKLEAYQQLDALDPCGQLTIAGASVAVPFVSVFVAAIVITEAVQLASGILPKNVVAGSVFDVDQLSGGRRDSDGRRVEALYSESME